MSKLVVDAQRDRECLICGMPESGHFAGHCPPEMLPDWVDVCDFTPEIRCLVTPREARETERPKPR